MQRRERDSKHISLDTQDQRVKEFVLSLELDPEGSVLELNDEPVARVLPVAFDGESVDREKLKAAILARRNESRALNEEWHDTDREVWDQT